MTSTPTVPQTMDPADEPVSANDFVLEPAPRPETVLAWIDVETNGLQPQTAVLLEVACILTDTDLNEIGDPYQATIRHDNAAELRAAATPFVQDMHDKTGLWDRLVDGIPAADVDTQLRAHIAHVAPQQRSARVAGNSVRLDLNFLQEYLPVTYDHMHYRSLDVTALFSAVSWWLGLEPMQKKTTHSALDDIRESLQEARIIKDFLTSNPHLVVADSTAAALIEGAPLS